jgi:hypothetical protein
VKDVKMIRKILHKTLRMQTLLLGSFVSIFLVTIGVFLTRQFWHEQLRSWAIGAVDVAAEKYVGNFPKLVRVGIVQLGEWTSPEADALSNSFTFDGHTLSIISERLLKDSEAEEFANPLP